MDRNKILAVFVMTLLTNFGIAQESYYGGNPHDKDLKHKEHKIGAAKVKGCCNQEELTITYKVGDIFTNPYKEEDKLTRKYPSLPNYYECDENVKEFEFALIEEDGTILAFDYKSGTGETPGVESLIIFRKAKAKSSKKEVEDKKKKVYDFFETEVRKVWANEKHEELKKVFLPKPGKMHTSTMTKEILSMLNTREGYSHDYYHAVITSNDWNIEHHPRTGVIIGRTVTVRVVSRDDDGDSNCSYDTVKIMQEYTGSGYQKSLKYYEALSDNGYIACENVK